VTDKLKLSFNPKLLCIIMDRSKSEELKGALREKNIRHSYTLNGMGTASSEILKAFGLSGTEKVIALCIIPQIKADYAMTALAERMDLTRPGRGIIFTAPISGVSAAVTRFFENEFAKHYERYLTTMTSGEEKNEPVYSHEMIIAVVNSGFSDSVMTAARANGARGGTIVNARRAGELGGEKFFGITIQDEKEIVAILAPKEIRRDIMKAIGSACGTKSDAHGIVFSIPVDDCAGLSAS